MGRLRGQCVESQAGGLGLVSRGALPRLSPYYWASPRGLSFVLYGFQQEILFFWTSLPLFFVCFLCFFFLSGVCGGERSEKSEGGFDSV